MSAITDVYQPIEKEMRLTRQCLEVMADCRQPVATMTKNTLALRDTDLWQELAHHQAAQVIVTLVTLDAKLAAGLDQNALKWAEQASVGTVAWGMLALAAPQRAQPVDGGALDSFYSNDPSDEYRKSQFLLAGLAGKIRIVLRGKDPKAFRAFLDQAKALWREVHKGVRVTADVDRTQDMLVQTLAVLVPNTLLVVGMFAVMCVVSVELTLVALVAFAAALVGAYLGQQLFAGEATRLAYGTDEAVEGRDSFLQKREPDWSPYPWQV